MISEHQPLVVMQISKEEVMLCVVEFDKLLRAFPMIYWLTSLTFNGSS